jgi:hypothetical protein
MSKVVNFNAPKSIDGVIEKVKENKQNFIAPKARMKQSIENDAQYLVALGHFISHAQKEMEKMHKLGKNYEASKIQIEIFDAIGKYQANEGLVNDKATHFEKVFLPMYEKELEESEKNFEGMLQQCKEALLNMKDVENKIVGFIQKEVDKYETSADKEDAELKNYTYKILKRLWNKLQEDSQK